MFFGELPVAIKHKKTLVLKNLKKQVAIFQIDIEKCPLFTTYTPMQGRIAPNDIKEVLVTF